MKKDNNSSFPLREMQISRIGYRSSLVYGSRVVDARKIIDHEIIELGNEDILATMNLLYGLQFVENNEENIEIIMDFLKKHFETDALYGKWLCSKRDHVTKNYGAEECEISRIVIPNKAIPISDLSFYGVLWICAEKTWSIYI